MVLKNVNMIEDLMCLPATYFLSFCDSSPLKWIMLRISPKNIRGGVITLRYFINKSVTGLRRYAEQKLRIPSGIKHLRAPTAKARRTVIKKICSVCGFIGGTVIVIRFTPLLFSQTGLIRSLFRKLCEKSSNTFLFVGSKSLPPYSITIQSSLAFFINTSLSSSFSVIPFNKTRRSSSSASLTLKMI